MKTPRRDCCLSIVDEQIYAVGGYGRSDDRLDSVERYNPESNAWMQIKNLPIAVEHATEVGYDGSLYVCGGKARDDRVVALAQKYESQTEEWTEVAPITINHALNMQHACSMVTFMWWVDWMKHSI